MTIPFVVLPSEIYTTRTSARIPYTGMFSFKRHSRVSTRFHAIYLADCYHVDSAAAHRPVRNGRQGRELGRFRVGCVHRGQRGFPARDQLGPRFHAYRREPPDIRDH